MPSPEAPLTIEPTPPQRRPEALDLLRLGTARIRRLLAAECRGEVHMAGLLHARRDLTMVGAAWGQIVPGDSAFCWPAQLVANEPEETALQLNQAVNDYLDSERVAVTQAVLSTRDVISAIRLTRVGYEHLADLDYLVSSSDQFPRQRPASPLTFEPLGDGDNARIVRLIERTYINTLDCSDLETERSMEDVLTGYRQTGTYRPEWWIMARYRDQDVGCVLVADYPEHEQSELVYLGIVPEMRGRHWGYELTRFAQWLIGQVGRERIVLAVDDANWPARKLYEQCGFLSWDRRSVYIRTTRSNGPFPPSSAP